MAVIERCGLWTGKDESGNKYLLYPITSLDCVDGAETLLDFGNAQTLTADQITQALKNLGITATAAELNYVDGVTSNIQTQLDGKAASSHGTHVTFSTTKPVVAGTAAVGTASTVARSDHVHPAQTSVSGNAGSADKLNTNAGSATQPVYFSNGVPVKTTYTLGASVPSGAKFTDTTYSAATTSAAGLMSAEDKNKLDGIISITTDEIDTIWSS